MMVGLLGLFLIALGCWLLIEPLCRSPVDPPTPVDPDWNDDNGRYCHICIECSVAFIGHKHRAPICRSCSKHEKGSSK